MKSFGINAYIAILAVIGITVHLIFRFFISSLQPYAYYPLFIGLLQ